MMLVLRRFCSLNRATGPLPDYLNNVVEVLGQLRPTFPNRSNQFLEDLLQTLFSDPSPSPPRRDPHRKH